MTEVHAAVGSYVVDAMDPAERAEFEVHLVGCERCQHEVTEYTEIVAELASLTAQHPPAELRTSVLSAISEVPQLIPDTVVRLHKHGSLAATPSPGGRTSTLAGGGDGPPVVTQEVAPEVAPLEEHPSVVPDWSWSVPFDDPAVEVANRRNRRIRWILTAVAAAAVLVALFLGGQVLALKQSNQAQVAAAQVETNVLTAPDAITYNSSSNGANVRFVVSKRQDRALFLGSDLPDPSANQTYQLWTLKDGKPTSAGLVPHGGSVRQLFAGTIGQSDTLAVTIEPGPNGSPSPTMTPLFTVTI